MNIQTGYRTITREQFLFREMKVVAKLLLQGKSDEDIIHEVVDDNLFQYPTEKSLNSICKVCLNRFHETESKEMVDLVANGQSDTAKQTCLFLMMNSYRLVWEFMIRVVGEKYRTHDEYISKIDFNSFFTQLQEQNEEVAGWSDTTIDKCKQVLKKLLVENGYLENSRSQQLKPVLLDLLLKEAIEHTGNEEAFVAFNYFR